MSLRRIPPRDPTASAEQEAARLRSIVRPPTRPRCGWAAATLPSDGDVANQCLLPEGHDGEHDFPLGYAELRRGGQ